MRHARTGHGERHLPQRAMMEEAQPQRIAGRRSMIVSIKKSAMPTSTYPFTNYGAEDINNRCARVYIYIGHYKFIRGHYKFGAAKGISTEEVCPREVKKQYWRTQKRDPFWTTKLVPGRSRSYPGDLQTPLGPPSGPRSRGPPFF